MNQPTTDTLIQEELEELNDESFVASLLEQARTNEIVTDRIALQTPTESTDISMDDAQSIAEIMLSRLDELGGVGLSANQLGLPIRLCVVRVGDPIWFLNPRLAGITSEVIPYIESCLSLPKTIKKPIRTKRHLGCHVASDNFTEVMKFQGKKSYADEMEYWSDKDLLECIAVQHEIDHLDGKLIFDRRQFKPRNVKPQYKRNDKVMFVNDTTGESKFIKYKKGLALLDEGWSVS